jgi:DNA-binding LacI/PurR family transcriptional regulator
VATVSYVLNNVAGQTISEQTRVAVRQAAVDLGYRPNLAARNLAVGASGVLLYVMPRLGLSEVSLTVASELTAELARHGIMPLVQFETADVRGIATAIDHLHPIAVVSPFPLEGEAAAAVKAADVPVINTRSTQDGEISSTIMAICELQVAHLESRGHRQLALALPDIESFQAVGHGLCEGLTAVTSRRGMPAPVTGTLLLDGTNAVDVVREWTANGVTGVCCLNDDTAFVVLHGIRCAGLRCPDDLAVIGADTGQGGFVSDPPLTSIGFDVAKLVDISISMLLEALGHQPRVPVVDGDLAFLVIRSST